MKFRIRVQLKDYPEAEVNGRYWLAVKGESAVSLKDARIFTEKDFDGILDSCAYYQDNFKDIAVMELINE